ncbi:hypothetical protein Syun_023328 [Stephania yunnanensis]|uniref:Uncharacterized protein n=1 Tax=Stephania yunnanensis TaxID=152371 RepID=A0AAP0FBW7_9MAGN
MMKLIWDFVGAVVTQMVNVVSLGLSFLFLFSCLGFNGGSSIFNYRVLVGCIAVSFH